MSINQRGTTRLRSRFALALLAAGIGAAGVRVSAHIVRGLESPTAATAFVSSPTPAGDAPIPIRWGSVDSGLRVVCFNVANSSPASAIRADWPRITGVGFELPGVRSGFALLAPGDGEWRIEEGTRVDLNGRGVVTLDFAIVASPAGDWQRDGHEVRGIPPGQAATRGSGTRFCVSGPFPDEIVAGQATTIEQILNGVVVGFTGVQGNQGDRDLGIWDNAARTVPLFLQ